ncbi:Ig-like domain repeat protein, partial [Methanobrevibacter sp.]|uniref:Ig-like domain repeat protein n=1 Tax=Methanobrevibacter sp. TaxID=66852 RepID=UPI003890F399
VVYGNDVVIQVVADVDGVYTLDLNGEVTEIEVVNGKYSRSLRLAPGKYYANVTFDNENYSNVITNAVFEVYKAVNNVKVIANNVAYGNVAVIYVSADVDGVYTVDVNGTIETVNVVDNMGNFTLSLGVGRYYANVTFDNGNYSNVITNAVFEVYPVENNVKVIVNSVTYGKDVVLQVVADVDGVYTLDFNGEISTINVVDGKYSRTMRLAAGKYYANVTFDDGNYSNIITNAVFEVYPAVNNVKVIAKSVTYGKETMIIVSADVDGVYTVDVNGTVKSVNVVNNKGNFTLSLGAGKYYANVTFDNGNYSSVITNAVFEVYPAVNNVKVVVNNVIYGNDAVILIGADVDGVYTVDVNGTIRTVNVVNKRGNFTLSLGVGRYYANVTFDNGNYSNIITNDEFEVYPAVNNVKVIVNNVVYGNDVVIMIGADVDGVYTVDVNGTIRTVNVVNKRGSFKLSLGAGSYYANVTFDNANYSSVITNALFEVYPAVNNVKVIVNSVTYGKDVVIMVGADVDGVYTVDVNGTIRTVNVVNNRGSFTISLGVGRYYANVTFADGNYSNVITNAVFEVYKAVNNVKVTANSVTYGNDVVLEVVADVDGVYTLDLNGEITTIEIVNGRYSRTLSLDVGEYYANVTFENDNYNTTVTNTVFEVYKIVNNVKVIAKTVTYGNDVVLKVFADVDGVYVLDLNGNISTINVVNGIYSISLSLDVGKYYANVSFADSHYDSIISNATFSVLPAEDYDMIAGATYNNELCVYVILPNQATGTVTINVAGKDYSKELNNGIALFTISDVAPGDYNISVHYSGDSHFAPKSTNFTFHVKKIMIDAYDAKYGWANSVTYSVKLIDEYGNAVYDKDVLFSINGKTFKSTTDANGIAKVTLSLAIGTYDIKISCQSENVTRNITIVSRFSGNKNINMYYFDGTKYSFRVYGNDGNPVGANQKVVVTLNKKTYTVKTNVNGYASLQIPNTVYKKGSYTITATYKGQTVKNVVKIKEILNGRKSVTVKKTAKQLVLKANLKKKLKGKTIVFKFYGKKYTVKTDKYGKAKVKITKNVINKLKKGKKYTVLISYYKRSVKTIVYVK